MNDHYEINDKDIESVVRWLEINDPANANREKAQELLQDLQAGFHQMSHNNPELLDKLRQELQNPDKNQDSK